MNPCGEIPLGESHPVMPWVQVQMMNWLRVRQGLPPFTPEEIQALLKELEEAR